ncbi:hypothetical protein PAPHI01_1072 [Pancytospora philotis]|nr:hypothetical protein PAPHI01_1072 [Pancytospora philotis]
MQELAPGTIVWAKYEDYPYWPGRIASSEVTAHLIEHKNYEGLGVLFFGEPLTYALVPRDGIMDFKENYRELHKNATEGFDKALEMALNKHNFEDPPCVIVHKKPTAKRHTKRVSVVKEDALGLIEAVGRPDIPPSREESDSQDLGMANIKDLEELSASFKTIDFSSMDAEGADHNT